MPTNCEPLPGFSSFHFVGGSSEAHCVYHAGNGPGVLLMHELPGMNPACINLAEEIAAAGFTVYLPLLFGHPGKDQGLLPIFGVCVRREFHLLATGRRSPITDWMRDLCAHIHAVIGGPGIGIIGMCMTGALVFALCASPAVLAAVTSQPSLPLTLFRSAKVRRDLGTAPDDLESARTRVAAEEIDILGLRFSSDAACPAERFETARRVFGHNFKPVVYPTPDRKHGLSRWAHPVLTGAGGNLPETHPVRRARGAVIAYLRERLLPAAE
jgi:dienelactone hydrolase